MRSSKLTRLLVAGLRRSGRVSLFVGDLLEDAGWRATIATLWQGLRPRLERSIISLSTWLVTPPAVPYSNEDLGELPLQPGVLFIGYAQGALGLGQAFRADLEAARFLDIPFAIQPIEKGIEKRMIGPFMPELYDRQGAYAVNVIEVSVDQLSTAWDGLGPARYERSYNILRTYWELPQAPKEWRETLAIIDEIWAPTQFIADAFAPIFEGAIHVIPPVVDNLQPRAVDRRRFGLSTSRFVFLFSFDYNSSPYRKNPLAVLDAFATAFPDREIPVDLVVKTNGQADLFPQARDAIATAARRDPRIHVIHAHLDREAMLDLIATADVYVSLHRAEGFGLGMAEAMALERLVVATDFSGNTDFLNSETGYPIPYRLRPIMRHEYPGAEGQFWAEPDVEAAARVMRELVLSDMDQKKKINVAREAVRRKYSRERVGKMMEERLGALM
ncbi:glycosyltransferase family 4 protein [Jiella sp. M17.18]|uniref:glycosyltransferase family 4 protein n=1 Tax=Jiella sp. M17.18 TaxID=3234247 RepID=UPI0034DE8165